MRTAHAVACNTKTEGADGGSSGGSGETQEEYSIGEKAHTGDFDVVVHQVKDPYTSTNQFDTPTEGHRFVAVEVEATNTSDTSQTLSTLIGAEVTDSANRPWDVALAGVDLPDLDGEVAAKAARRGWMVFEVATDATGLTLRLKGNITATGSLFRLS